MSKLYKGPAPLRGRQNARVIERVSLEKKYIHIRMGIKENMQTEGEDRSQPERGTCGVALSPPNLGEESEHAPGKPTSPKGLATPFYSKSLQPRPGAHYLQARDRANLSVCVGTEKQRENLKSAGAGPRRVWHGARSIAHREFERHHPPRRATIACESW